AIKQSLEKLSTDDVKVRVIHGGVGAITETDVTLASASNAIVIGFNVRPDSVVRAKATEEKVAIKLHRIIYALIEELEGLLKGYKKIEIVEEYQGQAEVRQVFKASKIGTVAGSYVVDGIITSTSLLRILRNGIIVYEGKIGGLKRFKDDVKDVKTGFECGISLDNFNDVHEGDIIEAYIMSEKKE
ncbi:MAG: translation initiation factor IF-2, partial [Bacilli bacterium]